MKTKVKALFYACITVLVVGISIAGDAQPIVRASGNLVGRDGLEQPSNVTLSLTHVSGNGGPKFISSNVRLNFLDRIILRVLDSDAQTTETFVLGCVAQVASHVSGDKATSRLFPAVLSESFWIRRNMGQFLMATAVIDPEHAAVESEVTARPGFGAVSSFLTRVESNDIVVKNNIPGTHADMRGVRLGLQEAMAKLALEIQRKAGSDFVVEPDKLYFVPHDEGRKAIAFILSFAVQKPGFMWILRPVASVLVPVSFVFTRNAKNDGYDITVNPTDIKNRDRIVVILDEGWDSDGTTLLNATLDAVADLDGAFYDVALTRLRRAVNRVRPVSPAPADFDIILLPTPSFDGTTSAQNPLRLRILE